MFFKLSVIFMLGIQISAERCTTPNNEAADCLSLYTCPVLINALATQNSISIEFVRLSTCGGTNTNPLVCCGSSSNFTVPVEIISNPNKENETNSLLPDKSYCGYQHSDDYFRQENKTSEINEFPWLAFFVYRIDEERPRPVVRCSGSLISNRYVLTAAHCIEQPRDFGMTLTGIRLGDFNIKSQTDCVNTTGIVECSDPFEDFGIEKTIVHSNFIKYNTKFDIGLIRLNRTVIYTDYIRPICLPFPGTTFAKVGETLLMSGWGILNNTNKLAAIKKKTQTKLITNEACAKTNREDVTVDHFCTRDITSNNEFGCNGDTGGPVIFSNKNQWHQEGIFPYGFSGCGGYFPNVHTKVKSYLDWIQANIES